MVDEKQRHLAIIPARGGSKRIPRKNVVDFHGKPMIAHTITAALSARVYDKVLVSTDDPEIAAIAREYGAEVPFLRAKYADDHSTVSDVVVNMLEELAVSSGSVTMLMANCPLRKEKQIISSHRQFSKADGDFQISAFDYGYANPWWAHQHGGQGSVIALFPSALKKRSQDLNKLLCPTGAIWTASVAPLLKHRTFYGPGYTFYEIDRVSATDIDDFEDLLLARALYLVRNG